jgi:hypothetical protein
MPVQSPPSTSRIPTPTDLLPGTTPARSPPPSGGEGKAGSTGGGETTITLSATHLQLIALSRLLLQRSSAKLVLLDEPAAGMEASASARLHGVSVPLIGSTLIACLISH